MCVNEYVFSPLLNFRLKLIMPPPPPPFQLQADDEEKKKRIVLVESLGFY